MLKVGISVLAEGLRITDIMTTQVSFLATTQRMRMHGVLHAKSIGGALDSPEGRDAFR